MSQKRGELTKRIEEKAKELLGYKLDKEELRLMVYIQYIMTNEQKIDPRKISLEERKILSKWKENEYMEGGMSGLRITKEFWDIMSEILFLGYVDID